MAQAEKERPTLLAQTVFLGTLALLFVLPVVGGAYLGHWIDGLQAGYSVPLDDEPADRRARGRRRQRLSLYSEALTMGKPELLELLAFHLGPLHDRPHRADHLAAHGGAGAGWPGSARAA